MLVIRFKVIDEAEIVSQVDSSGCVSNLVSYACNRR